MEPSPGETNAGWMPSSPCTLEAQCCRKQAHCWEAPGTRRGYTSLHGHSALQSTARHLPYSCQPSPCTAPAGPQAVPCPPAPTLPTGPVRALQPKDMYVLQGTCSEEGAELERSRVRVGLRTRAVPLHSAACNVPAECPLRR